MSQSQRSSDRYTYHSLQFLYEARQGREPPFRTFRRYSGQEQKKAKKLAQLIIRSKPKLNKRVEILDIGAGDGVFTKIFLAQLKALGWTCPTRFTWLEPNIEYAHKLKKLVATLPSPYSARVIQKTWEEYQTDTSYDRIILSHVLYYFSEADFNGLFKKMIVSLKTAGYLYIIARKRDEDYEFIERFFKRATGKRFHERTIDDAKAELQLLRREHSLNIQKYSIRSQMIIPFGVCQSDAENIVTFYLGKSWSSLDKQLQLEIQKYILLEKQGQFKQCDGILVIERRK